MVVVAEAGRYGSLFIAAWGLPSTSRQPFHVASSLAVHGRGMLTFKWYNRPEAPALRIPGFEQEYCLIKTIALSRMADVARFSR